MVNSRRLCKCIFAVLLIALSAVAVAKKQKIVVWGEETGPEAKGLEARVRAFERKFPQYEVELLAVGAGGMNPQKLITAIVGGVPPDVIYQDRFTVSDWAQRNAFMPLDDLIARDKKKNPDVPTADKYYAATWDEAIYNGKVYGIPFTTDDRVLYYNKTIFQQKAKDLRAAGLDPNRAPRTWTELLAYSKVLTEFNPDGTLKRAGFIPNFGNSWLYLYAFQTNSVWLKDNGRTCTMDNPQTLASLQFMVDGYAVLGGYAEAQRFSKAQHTGIDDPFVIGNIVMKVDGDWILQDLAHYAENMEFVTAPAPVPDDRFNKQGEYANEKDQYITWAGGMCMAIPQSARNAEGGWQYIQYMNTLEAFRIECTAQQAYRKSRGGLWSPRLMARIERNELTKREYMPKDEQISNALRMHIDMLSNARIRPASPVAQLMWDQHVRAMEKACLKEVSPKEALATAQAVVQEELNQVYADAKYPVVDMRLPAYLGLVAALIGIGIFYSRYRTASLQPLERHESRWGHILLIPWYIGFLGLTLGPMVMSLFFSFTHYNVLSPARWVGLENYHDLYADQQGLLKTALANVCYLGGVGVPLGLITGLSIALLLNNASRGIGFFRTAFYLPSIMPIVATVIVWLFILNADPTRGLVSSIWSHTIQVWFGKSPPGFITVAEWAKPSVIMMGVWGAGSGLFLWLAGLKAIPNTLYEAANLDGASASRQFFSITIPQLSPLIFYNTIIGVIGALQTFEASYVITGGENAGPNDSLLTPVYHLFRNGFAYFKMGYACALAWLLFVIILLVTLVQWRVLQRFVHTEVRDEK